MARNLTVTQAQRAASSNAEPINILKIEFGGEVGTKWFSDRDRGAADASSALNAQGRVASWGTVVQRYREDTANPVGDARIELLDADLALKGWLDQVEFQGKPVTLFQHFADLPADDILPVMVGLIAAPLRWTEKPSLQFDVTDISTLYTRDIGTVLDPEDFPMLAAADEGRMIPLVFGRVERSSMICLQDGAVTELVRGCSNTATRLYVRDAERFPQGAPITIRVNGEIIAGEFHGNTFHVSQRGVSAVESSAVTAERDETSFYDDALGGMDGQFRGLYIRVTTPSGFTRLRRIVRYSAAEGCVVYEPRITRLGMENPGDPWIIPVGSQYAIVSRNRSHAAGSRVYYGDTDYVFVVNDAPSKAARFVEARGRVARDQESYVVAIGDAETAWTEYGPRFQGWAVVEPDTYTVNLNDASIFGPSHPVTTLTFPRHPRELMPEAEGFHVAIEGVEDSGDGSGDLIEDPADVIATLLTRFAGAPVDRIDLDSFQQASADGAQYLRFAFALEAAAPAHRLVADLAFQARCSLLWEDGRATLRFLRNRLDAPAMTLSPDNIEEDSLVIETPSLDDLATEVRARYVRRGLPGPGGIAEYEIVIARDESMEAEMGRRSRKIDLWAYSNREYAAAVAGFWLSRWSFPWRKIRLRSFLPPLALLRQDVVEIDWGTYFPAGQRARVVGVEHEPGSAEDDRIDRISLALEAPVRPGCASACETDCESGDESGCHTACESEAQSCWQCETACEDGCEIFCTTASMTGCISFDAGCGGSCETACQSAGEGTCQTGCEVSCEEQCETACEERCEVECETGCEISCEESCELNCEEQCEIDCEIGCEVSCEEGCESSCQIGCETSCQTACETGCEESCQTLCQAACEAGCETACEYSCEEQCELNCEEQCEIECETGCEVSCEEACELSCEEQCEVECETGCEVSCEEQCEIECETGCEVSCEEQCEIECETGCEVSCEETCELTCENLCETECEVSCELGCEEQCETACQESCESACQSGCELECETAEEDICGTGCEVSCEHACQSSCQSGCELGCQSGCELACEDSCETSCETGAEVDPPLDPDLYYCTWNYSWGNRAVKSGGDVIIGEEEVVGDGYENGMEAGQYCGSLSSDCWLCRYQEISDEVTFTLSGLTGDASGLNGVWSPDYNGACEWRENDSYGMDPNVKLALGDNIAITADAGENNNYAQIIYIKTNDPWTAPMSEYTGDVPWSSSLDYSGDPGTCTLNSWSGTYV